jgi:hypothetical protein
MSAAENLVGLTLRGDRTKTEWDVVERLALAQGLTPGAFSAAYRVRSKEGREAFMKASDLAMLSQGSDPMQNLVRATSSFNFERTVLDHCAGNRLDKIVTALDAG